MVHVQLSIHQNTKPLLCRDALNEFFSQSLFMSGITLTQLQDLALGFIELPEASIGSLLKFHASTPDFEN